MVTQMGRNRTYEPDSALDNAMNLFWNKGFAGAHIQELVDVTGMNRFSIYQQYGGKAGFFEAALSRYLEMARQRYTTTLGSEPMGLRNVLQYFSAIDFGKEYHGCFMINSLTEKSLIPQKAFRSAKAFLHEIETLYLENVEAAQMCGDLSKQIDGKSIAKILFNFDLGLAISGIVNQSDKGPSIVKTVSNILSPLR